ncbi:MULTISPECIES: YlmC/YmxH family sporulation protein [Bacillus cereus group]|uniref:YlmC/YmxH family sporulation protein n=1 Tax=Bacillus cereus TaxID=1396 RepID=A0A9W7QK24_BACCE|nr:YlmC/YmxH family sporulation protein [Bacillus cereus]KAB2399156.1 YlmC/YmxH family sporulation protein [Bacillus cereus]KAB2409739.1 YlmC/YmxH family sporulation protein [Bacillus cereus]KAB2427297.1 YlmC/YmxH family sporulation protein [Bacillus cereus]
MRLSELSELSGKEVVDIEKAEKMGVLGYMDLEINEKDGQIQTLIIPVGKWGGFKKEPQEVRVAWSQIKKVGHDMLLCDSIDHSNSE